jgi:DNA polymerase III alpha subunit (gram-positive type)
MQHLQNYAVFDLETGGLVPTNNPITEIAIIGLDTDLNEIGRYESLIKIYNKSLIIQQEALNVSGLTLDIIDKKGKEAKIVCDEIIQFLQKCKVGKKLPILVGHNIDKFDIPFLVKFFEFNKKDLFNYINDDITIDTLQWSHLKWKMSINYKLGTCCQNAQVELTEAHRAMPDTVATSELVKSFIRSLRSENLSNNNQVKTFRESFQF